MPESIEDRIERFIRYYQRVAGSAASLNGEAHVPKLRKMCLLAVLDALAKAIYPNRENRTPFTQLILRFGGWLDCRKITLPHLAALLAHCPEPSFEQVRSFTNRELNTWGSGAIVRLDEDSDHEGIRSRWPRDPALRPPMDISLEHLQHEHLLYTLRNLLVHECRDQEDPIGEERRETPYYVHFTINGL